MQPLRLNAFPLRFDLKKGLAALWVVSLFSWSLVSFMAKIPSRRFSTTKKKIPSRKFPESQSKIPSRKFVKGSATIASRKFAKAPATEKQPARVCLDRPTNEEARQDRLEAVRGKVKSLLPASNL